MARYGGEEFLIIMPETDIDGACSACERLRELISDRSFNICSESIHVTASFGVSSFDPSGNNDRILPETLIDQSDKRMYTAKKLGRNRVEGEVP